MKKDKLVSYFLVIILLIYLLFTLFASNIINKIVLAISLLIYLIIVKHFFKRKRKYDISTKSVVGIMLVFAIIYLAAFYLMGLYFGFYKSTVRFSLHTIINYIIPISIIIISSEIVRNMFILRKNRKLSILICIAMILIDVSIYSSMYELSSLDDFLSLFGFTICASISCNILYNYISDKYGYKSVIIYRLITILYGYIIPIIPNVYVFFRSFLRMLYPYLIYLFLDYMYSKDETKVKKNKSSCISTVIAIIIMVLIIMLISCKFKFGILVIGSESMTGTINKGDATIYTRYDDDYEIEKKDIIIFIKNDVRMVHRVVEIKVVNGEKRYITKGDANQNKDDWYVTDKEIVGKSNFKIKYIGWPSIWLRDLFNE